ncbi:hypothetical protein DUNSADRAFT_7303 [Dunaliella salina]|uniref:Encoded protein n=1 Tax=Dunaliella salina TaxID=3046 RepID=A0ABQ7FTD3_DUNSA|nr:hypothetical protein DUNSADRAFT_7303 [Dunaliella salina]|eukprot:KAF5825727.1 hypothetical protein DUNSADRAFT_7303 [Dunaliella salina]
MPSQNKHCIATSKASIVCTRSNFDSFGLCRSMRTSLPIAVSTHLPLAKHEHGGGKSPKFVTFAHLSSTSLL